MLLQRLPWCLHKASFASPVGYLRNSNVLHGFAVASYLLHCSCNCFALLLQLFCRVILLTLTLTLVHILYSFDVSMGILYGVHRVGLNFLLWQSEKNLEYRWEKVKKKVHKGNISNKYRWDKYVQKTVAYNEIFYALKAKMCSYQLFAKILPAVKKS